MSADLDQTSVLSDVGWFQGRRMVPEGVEVPWDVPWEEWNSPQVRLRVGLWEKAPEHSKQGMQYHVPYW